MRPLPVAESTADQGKKGSNMTLTQPSEQQIPCRLTRVWRREGGERKPVRSHASIGVPNAHAFGP